MLFKQFYLGCLAHASYMIADGGEAAIVDPQRDVDQYIEEANQAGAKIKYIIETHLHADFVSGHQELAERTGAKIIIGSNANAAFEHHAVNDGDTLRIGSVELRALATPGHTPESFSWLVEGKKLLTGDTLFIGDVGRPDLAGGRGYTPEMMASMMYDTLHAKLLKLPDDVEVWPAHGAGSACGRSISKERSSTIGAQKQTNYALRPMSREEFVQLMTTDMPAAPQYFPRDAELNRRGARPLKEVTAPKLTQIDDDALVLDVRSENAFGTRHIAGAVNIGLGGQFASWAGTLLPADAKIVIAAESDERASEAVMRLARVGIESAVGFVTDDAQRPTASLQQVAVTNVDRPILDVRGAGEFVGGHAPGAINVPLAMLPEHMSDVPKGPIAVMCGGGYRSSIACSLLLRAGRTDIVNVTGGTGAWIRAGLPIEA
jgi:glyoxylase-like metal-dependent hydrolase (beta-lactamase superfamily II)/rhodanese-related sulfurtransferase